MTSTSFTPPYSHRLILTAIDAACDHAISIRHYRPSSPGSSREKRSPATSPSQATCSATASSASSCPSWHTASRASADPVAPHRQAGPRRHGYGRAPPPMGLLLRPCQLVEGAFNMAELSDDTATCCEPAVQAVCCEPAEKASCCGTAASGGSCGCAESTTGAEGGDEIREQVRERYAAAARSIATGSSSCCDATLTTTDASGTEVFGSALYAADDVTGAPDSAVSASLGWGIPPRSRRLRRAEDRLDLGSGGGIDVLLSAKRVGPTGRAYAWHDRRDARAGARECGPRGRRQCRVLKEADRGRSTGQGRLSTSSSSRTA